jgi:hypothetical protein
MDRKIQFFTKSFEALELIIDEGFERSDVERAYASFLFSKDAAEQGKKRRLGLSRRGGSGNQHVAPTGGNGEDRLTLNIAQFGPALPVHPALDAGM